MAVEKVGEDEGQKLKATCKNCGAMLQFYRKDVISQDLYISGEYEGKIEYVVCPDCSNQVAAKMTH